MRILFPLILKYREYIDEYRLYVATTIQSDIDYMRKFANENPFVKLVYCEVGGEIILNDKVRIWNNAYKTCQEENTVYLKLDDDIVYLDETLFNDFIKYRIQNRNAPLLYPVIINNLYISNLLQNIGAYNPQLKSNMDHSWKITYSRIRQHIMKNSMHPDLNICHFTTTDEVLCPVSWGNIKYCVDLHTQFLNDLEKDNIGKYYLKHITKLNNAEPASINACSWIGEDLKQLLTDYPNMCNDENWWSVYVPTWTGRFNEIYNKSVVSHYAYYRQRELGLDNYGILDRYYDILFKK